MVSTLIKDFTALSLNISRDNIVIFFAFQSLKICENFLQIYFRMFTEINKKDQIISYNKNSHTPKDILYL